MFRRDGIRSEAGEPMIKAEKLKKRYGATLAVDDLSFDVAVGSVTGFLGPNGAGKSTTMRLMLGLDNGGGVTRYDGKPLHKYRRPSQVVGLLLEAKAFHPTRTAGNHLRVLATAGGIPGSRVDEALDAVGLRNVRDRRPGKFSLGMSQRLGIAAAVLGEPKYLILDEPANGLDPEGIVWLRQFLKDYADRGNAVFMSSHVLGELAQLVDDVVVIGRGRLIATGSMQDLLASKSQPGVFVRTSAQAELEQLLHERRLVYQEAGGGIEITGVTTDSVSRLAFQAGIPLLELTRREASLEDIFLELTEDAGEYRASTTNQSGRD
jgi:ABC-2 type transport system ATP-binding protein